MPRRPLPLIEPRQPEIPVYEGDIEENMARIGTIKAANEITGGLSKPSKMPEWAYNLPATECKVGGRLQEIRGSVCERCYALTNRYAHPNVTAAMRRRFEGIFRYDWTPAMALTILKREIEHFRWHDSGDIQSLNHLLNILSVVRHTPLTRHWLPFREYEVYRSAIALVVELPPNLTARASAHMIGDPPPKGFAHTSTVHASRPPRESHVCPAPDQGNRCGKCRACWDPEVKDVAYWLH